MTIHRRVKQAHRGLSASNSTKVKKSVPTSVKDNATLKKKNGRRGSILEYTGKLVFDQHLFYFNCTFVLLEGFSLARNILLSI